MPTESNIARLPIGTLFFVPRLEKERELDREKGVGWDVSRETKNCGETRNGTSEVNFLGKIFREKSGPGWQGDLHLYTCEEQTTLRVHLV